MIRRLAALTAALGMTILWAAPAMAVDINPAQVPTSSNSSTVDQDCSEWPNIQPGQVGWLFVLNQSDTDTQTLTVTFQNFNGGQPYTFSATQIQDHYNLHYALITGEDTLLAASTSGTTGNLLLSHICNGGPGGDVPEAPMSALLILSSGLAGLGFVAWRMRRSRVTA